MTLLFFMKPHQFIDPGWAKPTGDKPEIVVVEQALKVATKALEDPEWRSPLSDELSAKIGQFIGFSQALRKAERVEEIEKELKASADRARHLAAIAERERLEVLRAEAARELLLMEEEEHMMMLLLLDV